MAESTFDDDISGAEESMVSSNDSSVTDSSTAADETGETVELDGMVDDDSSQPTFDNSTGEDTSNEMSSDGDSQSSIPTFEELHSEYENFEEEYPFIKEETVYYEGEELIYYYYDEADLEGMSEEELIAFYEEINMINTHTRERTAACCITYHSQIISIDEEFPAKENIENLPEEEKYILDQQAYEWGQAHGVRINSYDELWEYRSHCIQNRENLIDFNRKVNDSLTPKNNEGDNSSDFSSSDGGSNGVARGGSSSGESSGGGSGGGSSGGGSGGGSSNNSSPNEKNTNKNESSSDTKKETNDDYTENQTKVTEDDKKSIEEYELDKYADYLKVIERHDISGEKMPIIVVEEDKIKNLSNTEITNLANKISEYYTECLNKVNKEYDFIEEIMSRYPKEMAYYNNIFAYKKNELKELNNTLNSLLLINNINN